MYHQAMLAAREEPEPVVTLEDLAGDDSIETG